MSYAFWSVDPTRLLAIHIGFMLETTSEASVYPRCLARLPTAASRCLAIRKSQAEVMRS